jgi:hypothetical protein
MTGQRQKGVRDVWRKVMNNEGSLSIPLTRDEALVLLEVFGDFGDEAVIPVKDQAERRALWNLTALLEKALAEVFSSNYRELVESGKRNLSY